jgi:hypothetical protein
MILDEPITKKRSLGKLRAAERTKDKSPEMTGTLLLQRHTLAAILKQFEASDCGEAVCNIAGWVNRDNGGDYLTVELSPKYEARQWRPSKNNLAFLFGSQERDK